MTKRRLVARMELTERKLDRRFRLFSTADAATSALISAIGREFAHGYNDTLRSYDPSLVRAHVEAQDDDHLTPFYVEGASMALAAGRVLHPGRSPSAHRRLLAELPEHDYLILVGWGWWYAVRPAGATGLARSRVWSADDLFSSLAIDGMAFATCFLKTRPPHYDVTCPFRDEPRRRVWLQGYGRALWFVAGGRPEVFRRQYERLEPELRPELYAGIGLATAFAGLRDMTSLPTLPANAPSDGEAERRAFYQGLAFGLTARRKASPRSYQRFLDRVDTPTARWVTEVTDRCADPPRPGGTDAARAVATYTAWERELRHDVAIELFA